MWIAKDGVREARPVDLVRSEDHLDWRIFSLLYEDVWLLGQDLGGVKLGGAVIGIAGV